MPLLSDYRLKRARYGASFEIYGASDCSSSSHVVFCRNSFVLLLFLPMSSCNYACHHSFATSRAKIIGVAPVRKDGPVAAEKVTDSSRYFVLRIENSQGACHAFQEA